MLFNSIDFLIFFPVVVLVYLMIPKKIRYIWLLVTSYYFYMSWNAQYALLILASTLTTYLAGWLVHKVEQKWVKRTCLWACLGINLGILFFFKYFDFFLDSLNKALSIIKIQAIDKPFDVLLPVGISFYTFQVLGYIIDVYKGKAEPEKNILKYALFVSFFPQLVAGPIGRTDGLLKQIHNAENIKVWDYSNITRGLTLMVWGLFAKMVISDRVALLVDCVFANVYMEGTVALIAGAVGYALQIYCDFMGYSTVAMGAAKVMGFELIDNFDTPYFAQSIAEFWRRWHISLSTWLRDYVYIPLGGNRKGKVRKYFNLLVTFGVSGLWHGANWNFVAWGLLHAVYQIVGDISRPLKEKIYALTKTKTDCFSFKLLKIIGTFTLVDIAWIFFRAGSLSVAVQYIKRIFTKWDPWSLFNGELYTLGLDRPEFNILIVSTVILLLVDLIRYFKKQTITAFLEDQNIWFRWASIILLIGAIIIYGMYGINFNSAQFIYSKF